MFLYESEYGNTASEAVPKKMNGWHSDQVVLFHNPTQEIYQLTKRKLMMHRVKVYLALIDQQPGECESRIYNIFVLFQYLLTEDFLELMREDSFSNFRIMIEKKIDQLKNSPYIVENKKKFHELMAALAEMKWFLNSLDHTMEDNPMPRRSERFKQKVIKKRNEDLKKCDCNRCVRMYFDLTYNGPLVED